MPENGTLDRRDVDTYCRELSRLHLEQELREDGLDPLYEVAGARILTRMLPFPSTYREMLQVEWDAGGWPVQRYYYFLLHRQYDNSYRVEDLQVAPTR